jgi:hypothetical protein
MGHHRTGAGLSGFDVTLVALLTIIHSALMGRLFRNEFEYVCQESDEEPGQKKPLDGRPVHSLGRNTGHKFLDHLSTFFLADRRTCHGSHPACIGARGHWARLSAISCAPWSVPVMGWSVAL